MLAVVSMGIDRLADRWGGEVTRTQADTQARMGFSEHRGEGTKRCLRKKGKMEVKKDDDKVRFKS